MCGIAGYLGDFAAELLPRMNQAQAHRGPDGQGVWSSGRVGLAHVRLAILDLSPAGHQPMSDARGRVTLVFNGAIVNHVELRETLVALGHAFTSRSDTEVLLRAYLQWGEAALEANCTAYESSGVGAELQRC